MGLTDFSLSKMEYDDPRCKPALLSESGTTLCLEDPVRHDVEATIRMLRQPSRPQKLDHILRNLPVRLRSRLPFDYICLVLMRGNREGRIWYEPDGQNPSRLTSTELAPREEPLLSWVVDHQDVAVIPNVEEEIRFSNFKNSLRERALKSVCAVPLATPVSQIGAILIGSKDPNIYSKKYAQVLSVIADQIAMAVDSVESHTQLRRYEALSRLSTALATSAPENLSSKVATILDPLLHFDFLDLVVFKEGTSEVLWHSIGAGRLPTPDVPMEETTCWWVYQQQQPLCIADWKRDERFAVRRDALMKVGFEYRSLCRVPLRTPHGPLGVFSVASSQPHDYSEEELGFLLLVADQVAVAVANALNLERSLRAQSELDSKSARLELLHDLTISMAAGTDLKDVLRVVTIAARRLMRSDLGILGLRDLHSGQLRVYHCDLADNAISDQETVDSLGQMFGARVISTGQSWRGSAPDIAQLVGKADSGRADSGFPNCCVLPLVSRDRVLGILAMARRADKNYSTDELDFLKQLASQVAIAVERFHAHEELRKQKDDSSEQSMCREKQRPREATFAEIVGRSAALERVLQEVEVVAPTGSGVLIQGETGTGKELIARAIHDLSARHDHPFIKLNCAAIPSGLLESELFGHEKGAFTGAIMRKAGRFEVADKGTLFLDEVGDIPLELQPKLLRVLQEHEFEKLGSTRTQKVDVRVIAATHRDLKRMVEDGQFRSDLFYRLHVFPLSVPPLRERREDIPSLVRHYVDKCAKQLNRQIETIPSHALEVLTSYSWPGNVRELQNFVERAVILSPGSILRPPLEELKQVQESSSKVNILEEAEREHVRRALRESNWVIGGPNGAAARLGLKRTTLAYRIRKLKIPCRPL
jgi:formate hydrogenlyase transcriptional activator